MTPICQNVKVKLTGEDGNAFMIIGRVLQEMRKQKIEQKIVDAFKEEATSADYDNLLKTCIKYVNII